MKHLYKLFFVLFVIGLIGCNDVNYKGVEEPCETIFYAKTLEGKEDITLCRTPLTATFKFGRVNGEILKSFSVDVKDIQYHVEYSEFADEEELELYFPYQSSWYGIYLYSTLEGVNDATYSISRDNPLVRPDSPFYDRLTLLQTINLDTESAVDNIQYAEFTAL